jgi:signal transduction histidine kinase
MSSSTETETMTTARIETDGAGGQTWPARAREIARRSGLDLAYLGGMLLSSVLAFAVVVTGVTATLSLLPFVVGIFVWLGTAYAFRWTAGVDRRLAGWIRAEPIAGLYRAPRQEGVLARIRCVTTDPQTWKDLGWLSLHSLLGFVLATAAITITAAVIGLIAMPAWWWAIPDSGQAGGVKLGLYTVDSAGVAWITSMIGLALAPPALLLNREIVAGHSSLAARILGPSEDQRLRARVEELASSRSGAVEAAQDQLERIERDLHDGAQARLVSLAMELGMAEEELRSNPEAAREVVVRARAETLAALGELRDLSRGIRPALLEERGLATAVEALAERTPTPATLTLHGELDQLPEAVRTAAYFTVAEALTNAAKHSGAERVRVRIERQAGRLTVEIEDDGRGGADPGGSGLDGLRKRLRALDGRLEAVSPSGGPTVIRAEIPCG